METGEGATPVPGDAHSPNRGSFRARAKPARGPRRIASGYEYIIYSRAWIDW
jgi:hypothetical protein